MNNLQYIMDSERLLLTPALDEYIFTKDTHLLYYGDGVTPGGRSAVKDEIASIFATNTNTDIKINYDAITQTIQFSTKYSAVVDTYLTMLSQDTAPSLGGNLNLNAFDITGVGNVNISGAIKTEYLSIDKSDVHTLTQGFNVHNSHPYPLSVVCITDGTEPNAPTLSLTSSRGTIDAPEDTKPGDVVGSIAISGYYNNEYHGCAGIRFSWDKDAKLGTNTAAAVITLATGNNNGGSSEATFTGVTGAFYAPVLQTGTSYPANPLKGMIIFNDTDNHFYGYNGTSWKQLDN